MKIVSILNRIEEKILSKARELLFEEQRFSPALGAVLFIVGAFILPAIQILRHFVNCFGVDKE